MIDLINRFFDLNRLKTDIRTEIMGGITTFMTMAYIILVNPAILKVGGIPTEGAIIATCVVAGIMSISMGIYANYPFALASGMGLNAVVVYNIIVGMKQPWQVAMGVIVAEGLLVTILVLTNLREMVMNAIPIFLKHAISVGIGLFIAFIGLVEGGIVVKSPATLVTLGNLTQPYVLVSFLGLIITSLLVTKNIKGGILLGIIFTALLAILLGIIDIPKEFVSVPEDFSTFLRFDLMGALNLTLIPMIFALFMSDFFDTMGTVIGIGGEAGFLDSEGRLPRLKKVLIVDSLAAILGGALGASSATTYIESASGVSVGGRSGLTAVITGLLFLASLLFTPLVSIIAGGYITPEGILRHPITAPALIVVGFLMINIMSRIDFRRFDEGIPAFLTIITMPFTYSISHGIGIGFISYSLIQVLSGRGRNVHPLMYIASILFAINFIIPAAI